jgi:hypothetical protein
METQVLRVIPVLKAAKGKWVILVFRELRGRLVLQVTQEPRVVTVILVSKVIRGLWGLKVAKERLVPKD